MASPYPYKTQPYAHQRDALRWLASGGSPRKYAALFMEQRTGKTKTTIDEASYLFLSGRIGALLVVAPSGVHSNWIRDEIPLHMPDEVERICIEWRASKARQKLWPEKVRRALHRSRSEGKLLVLAINIEALITEKGKAVCRTLLKSRPTMMVIDESTDIKDPGAKRTKSAKALGRLAAYRRILSGFPDPEGPMDLYAQLSFLSPHIVGSNAAAFRSRYGQYEQVYYQRGAGAKPVPKLVGYQNLDELQRIIDSVSFRVRRADVMDLPPKIYAKHYFDMTKEQERMYRELEQEWQTSFRDGEEVTAELSVVRMGRLQQIASGYVPTDNPEVEEPIRRIPGVNARLEALKKVLADLRGEPTIIWCRWRMDTDLLMSEFKGAAFRYDGAVGAEDRERAKRGFQNGERPFFIGNPQAAGRGLTLSRAGAMVYFSHHWGLETRVQSEDRGEGKTQTIITDIIATDSVDEKIVNRLRQKDALARPLIGDDVREWI